MDTISTQDKRLFDRFMARFPVKFRDSRQEFGTNVFLQDLSASGARITSQKSLFLNDTVNLLVQLPDGKDPFPLSGQVVWSKREDDKNWDAGIRFHKLSLMGLQRIFRFCLDE